MIPGDGSAGKQFAGFLSHYKHECGTEARLVEVKLTEMLPKGHNNLFLDSDDLNDLRLLLQHVKDTEVLVLLQSKGVLTVRRAHTYAYKPAQHAPTHAAHPHQCTHSSAPCMRTHAHTHHTHTHSGLGSSWSSTLRSRTTYQWWP